MKIRNFRPTDSKQISYISKVLSKWFTTRGRRSIRRSCNTQNGFVAYNKKVVGFIFYKKWKRASEIKWIGILPEYQKKGVGTKLVRMVENKVKKIGVTQIKVSTLAPTVKYKPYEQTREFYRKIGFKKHRIDKGFFRDGSDRLDRLLLMKKL